MEKKFKRTTVTSALPYANGPVHIGHLAGVYVPADIYVRYLRLKKEDVLFIGGSDWLRISSKHYTIKENSSKKHPNNITTRKQKHSLPTVISPENVLTAIRKALTATNAKSAEPHFLLQILSTRKAPSAVANR